MGKGAWLYVPLFSRVGAAGVHSSGENKSQHCGLGAGFLPSLWECGSYIFSCQACFPFLIVIIELSFPVEAFFIWFCWVWPHSLKHRGGYMTGSGQSTLFRWLVQEGSYEPSQKIRSLPQDFISRAVREKAFFLSAGLPALRMTLSWNSLLILRTHEGSLSEDKANTEGSRAEKWSVRNMMINF